MINNFLKSSTGPTTSSRHSNKDSEISTGPTTSSRHSKKFIAGTIITR